MTKVFSAFLLLVSTAIGGIAVRLAAAAAERFAGEAKVGSQPPLPVHLELRRHGDAVMGNVSIPGGSFELVEAQGADTIVGRFRGDGGSGALTLRVDGDAVTGVFDLEGQPGAITARRTPQSAETFFRPPEQQLDLTPISGRARIRWSLSRQGAARSRPRRRSSSISLPPSRAPPEAANSARSIVGPTGA